MQKKLEILTVISLLFCNSFLLTAQSYHHVFSGGGNAVYFDIAEAPEGKLVIGGGGFGIPEIMVLDSTYNLDWSGSYPIPNSIDEDRIYSICADSQGNIYALGNNYADVLDIGTWIFKTTPTGDLEWLSTEKFGGMGTNQSWHKIEIVNEEVHALFARHFPVPSSIYARYEKNGNFKDTVELSYEIAEDIIPFSWNNIPDSNGWFFNKRGGIITKVDFNAQVQEVYNIAPSSIFGAPHIFGKIHDRRYSFGSFHHPFHNNPQREVTYSKVYEYDSNWYLTDSINIWHDSTLQLAPDTLTDVNSGLTDAICHPRKGIIGIYSAAIGNEHPRIGYPSLIQIDPTSGTVLNYVELTGEGKNMAELHILHDRIIGSTNLTGYSFGLDLFEINFPDLPSLTSTDNETQTLDRQKFVQVSPNPAKQQIELTGIDHPSRFIIFNINGQMLMQGTAQPGQIINTADLEKGMYILQIEGYQAKKLIIQ
jgi:hypothetical protein